MGLGGDAGLEFATRRIVGTVDAALALCVDGAQVVGRHQDEQDRRIALGRGDAVAPARSRCQVFLVEKDLVVAEHGVEVACHGRGHVGAVAAAVADENSVDHGAPLTLRAVPASGIFALRSGRAA